MITHSTSPASPAWHEQESHAQIRATDGLAKKDNVIFSSQRVVKWLGAISTVLLSVAAFAPNIFHIPANLQPWIFITDIFWALAFCAGMFDL